MLLWSGVAVLGALAYGAIACRHGEPINSAYILIAAVCTYVIGHRFYSKWIAARVLALDDRRATPSEVHDDGKDFVRTNKWIVFGHHFAAIAGPGPLVGPVLAAQFGYLPGMLWILIGAVLGGAVQDFVILFASMRRDGNSLGEMMKEELNSTAGVLASLAILAILTILLAVLALVVVKVLAESPWGIFTVAATVPIALAMGCYLRFVRVGKVLEATAFGVALLLLAVWGGKLVYQSQHWSQVFGLADLTVAFGIIGYGIISSSLPVWLLLAPRDYLSTFMKLGTIGALALGILCVLPNLAMPAISRFVDGSGLVVAGKVFPFCFITIACGAISGFHSLIASGTTPKMITRENYARHIGYGAMCCESFVAIMALIAACTLEPGVYLSMNIKGDAAATVAKVTALGFPVAIYQMQSLAQQLGEKSLFGRTGGAATLAVGMAHIFSRAFNGRWLDLWYHFAVMFEALFILTTLDAGTRVGRYLIQQALGRVWQPLGNTKDVRVIPLASAIMVGAWGYFLIQGVCDPLGGINSLWPLFGIANQMLAAMALCLATTIILKKQIRPAHQVHPGRKAFGLITLVPLAWLLAVTLTAGVEKIIDADPRIGFLAQAKSLDGKLPALQTAAESATDGVAVALAQNAVQENRRLKFNSQLDAAVTGLFLALAVTIVLLSGREWFLVLSSRRAPTLFESQPVWLPDYAVKEAGQNLRPLAGTVALTLVLAKELSGEAGMERTREINICHCENGLHPQTITKTDQQLYLEITERRFNGVKRCC